MGDREKMYKRIDEMISEDKEIINAECKRLFEFDFLRIAREYFEVVGEVAVKVEKRGKGYAISIEFLADRVKNCHFIK